VKEWLIIIAIVLILDALITGGALWQYRLALGK